MPSFSPEWRLGRRRVHVSGLWPSIAGVQLGGPGGIGHFITILGKNGNKYIVGDPTSRRGEMDLTRLRERYYFTGFFLVAGK